MKKLFVLAMAVALSISLVWAADSVNNTVQNAKAKLSLKPSKAQVSQTEMKDKAEATSTPADAAAKAPKSSYQVPTSNVTPQYAGEGIDKDAAARLARPSEYNGDVVVDYYDKSNAPVEQEAALEAPQPTKAEKDAAALSSPTMLDFLQQAAEQQEQPEAISAPYVEEPKWQPQYGEKGELLNAPQMIRLDGQNGAGIPGGGDIICVNKMTQDFEGTWTAGLPPGGWTEIDSGTEGTQNLWWVDKWHKFYYNASGWYDTCLASMWSTAYVDSMQSTWAITPSFDLSAATACTLFLKEYYDNVSTTTDTASLMVSVDNGTTWARARFFAADSITTRVHSVVLTPYVGPSNTQVRVGFWHKYGPVAGSPSATNGWVIDDVRVKVDGTDLWTQTFSNQMSGWFGNTPPPAGWSINSNGSNASRPKAWNNNDWYKRASALGGSAAAAITYVGSNARREWENDWLFSPACTLSTSVACTLSFAQLFSTDNMGNQFPPNTNYMPHYGYVKIQETTDNGVTWGPWTNIDVYNNAQKGLSTPKVYFKYDISSWSGKAVRIAFQQVNNPDQNYGYWYIDDVKIDDYVLATDNVGTLAVTSPIMATTGRNWPIKSKVFNNGSNAETFEDSVYIEQPNKTVLMYEGFGLPVGWTGANPPTGWTVLDSGSVPGWQQQDWHQYYNSASGDTLARVYYASGVNQNEWLISPVVNCSAQPNVHLTFRTYFNWEGTTDTAYIFGTTDGWATRVQIDKWYTDHGTSDASLARYDYDISSWAAGQANVQIAFKYLGLYDLYWMVDDAELYTVLPPTIVYQHGETVVAMPSLTSQIVTQATTWDNPSVNTYTLRSLTSLAGDLNAADNQVTTTVTSYAHTGAGGPDAGSYTFKDDITGGGGGYNWLDISSIGTPINFNFGTGHARYTAGIGLGFPFWYYGQTKSRIYLSEDGYITFDSLTSTYSTNYNFPYSSTPNNLIGLFWDDLIQSTGNAYFWTNNVDTAIVSFVNWGIFATGDTLPIKFDAQVIFSKNDARIKMQYRKFEPGLTLSHSIGIENAAGTAGLQYVYNGAPMGNLPIPPLAITFYAPVDEIVASSLVSPASYMVAGATYSVQGRFKNNGSAGQTIDAQVVVDNGATNVVVKDTTVYGITINASDSATVDFGSLVPATAGTYTFTLTAINPGDEIPSNNTLNVTRTVYAHEGVGGPDAGYYSWIDNTVGGGPTFSWVDMTGATPVTFLSGFDDTYSYPVYPSAPFFFYGNMQNKVVFCSNGLVVFDSIGASPSPYFSNIPAAAAPNNYIGFMRSDMYCRAGGTTYLNDIANNRFVIQYDSIYFYNTPSQSFDCQVILDRDDSTVTIQYNNFGPTSQTDAVIGIENSTGTIGLEYYYNATLLGGLGNYPYNGLAIKFYYVAPARDIALLNILSPTGTIVNGATFTPSVRLANQGAIPETFDVVFKMFEDPAHTEIYNQTVSYVGFASGVVDTAEFLATSITVNGAHSCTTYVVWPGTPDPNPANDWLRSTFNVDQHFGEGGPDAFLYKWIDNWPPPGMVLEDPPVYSWIELNPDLGGSGTLLSSLNADDAAYKVLFSGNTFPFYGVNYDSCWATTNGLITFGTSSTAYSNTTIPTAGVPNNFIAPFWDDMYYDYTNGARFFYQNFSGYTVIEWYNYRFNGTTAQTLQFEVILYTDGEFIVQYKNVDGTTRYQGSQATMGIENSTGTTGLQYLYNGVPALNVMVNNLAIKYYLYTPTLDVAMISYDAPRGGWVGLAAYPSVTVKNNGLTATTADVTVKIIGPAPATDTVFNATETTPVIPSVTTVPFTFTTNSWTPAAAGSYTTIAIATTAGDEFASNNTVTGSAFILGATVSIPFSTDFEANNGGFLPTNEWEWGIPTYAGGPSAAHSPVNLWGTDLDNTYDASTHNVLYAPPLDLTGAGAAVVKFWMWFDLESGYDGANVKISTDLGATWNVITTSVAYNSTGYSGAPGIAGQPVWSGSLSTWTEVVVNLSAYVGQTVFMRFDQSADGSVQYAGFYIDDFSLEEPPPDLYVNSINVPTDVFAAHGRVGVLGQYGAQIGDAVGVGGTVDATLNIYDPSAALVHTETVTGVVVPAGGFADVAFPTGYTPASNGAHTLEVTIVTGDPNPANDVLTRPLTVSPVQVAQYYDPADGPYYYNSTDFQGRKFAQVFTPLANGFVTGTTQYIAAPVTGGDIVFAFWPMVGGVPDTLNPIYTEGPYTIPPGFWIYGLDLSASPIPVTAGVDIAIGHINVPGAFNDCHAMFELGDDGLGRDLWDRNDGAGYVLHFYGDWWTEANFSYLNPSNPEVATVPASFNEVLPVNSVGNFGFTLFNMGATGTPDLNWSASSGDGWIQNITPASGTLPAVSNTAVTFDINTAGLIPYTNYSGSIVITSNDPLSPYTLPVSLYTATTPALGLAESGNFTDIAVSNHGVLGDYDAQAYTYDWGGTGGVNYGGTLLLGNSGSAMLLEYGIGANNNDYRATEPLDMTDTFHPTGAFDDGGTLYGGLSVAYSGEGFHTGVALADSGDFFFHKYVITNNTGAPITGLLTGLYFDWDIGATDVVTFDRANNLIIQGPAAGPYYGIALLSGNVNTLLGVSQQLFIYPPPDGHGAQGWIAETLFVYMNQNADLLPEAYADMGSMLSFGPFDLGVGESETVAFAVIGGATAADVAAGAEMAFSIYTGVQPCVYIPGDINGTGLINGVQVQYGVNYFKGFGPPPPFICPDCPNAGDTLFATGDVNGTCEFNGVDIQYFVNYLKGLGPDLTFCASCPPGALAPAVVKPGLKVKATKVGGAE